MKEPKSKPSIPPPKTLKRDIRIIKYKKTSLGNPIDNIHKANRANNTLQKHMPDNQQHENPESYATDNVTEKSEYVTRKMGEKASGEMRNAARDNFQKSSRIGHTQSGKRTIKNAIHTGQKPKQTVKTSRKTVKATKKGIKSTTKTAKRTAQVTKKTAISVKKSAIAAAKAAKATVKAIVTAVKAAITAIKGLAAAIAAGGWVVVVIIIVVVAIIAVMASPLAIFSNETDGTTPTISEVVQEINGEYSNTITNIIINAGEVDEIIIEGESARSEFQPNNWIDVIGIFSVKSTITSGEQEFLPVVYMENKQIKELNKVFWDLNTISYEIIEEVVEPEPTPTPEVSPTPSPNSTEGPTPEPTTEPTPQICRTLIISIESKTYEEGIEIYKMSEEQIEVLEEMISADYLPMFMEICGMDSYIGLTSEQMLSLINDLPSGKLGSVIVEYALSRLGDPYSQPKRGQGDYVDCSYLTLWCYLQAGVSSFTAGTAAEQARYCVDNNLCVAYSALQPGDLIFWSFNTNGRFMNVTHTGIYAGNGYVIDASSSRGMVVYRPIFGVGSIVACGRPHVKN